MSAFQAYSGAYEFAGNSYGWRCYATARVYEVRQKRHAPLPSAPHGRKWVAPPREAYEADVTCLVDATVEEFSQILLQVEAEGRAEAASAAA
jgi:hypothetical protein